jgi:hypothetical protein
VNALLAFLNVSGERTEGSAPMYGVVLELVPADQAEETAKRYDTHDTHRVAVGRVEGEPSKGERVRYVPVVWRS